MYTESPQQVLALMNHIGHMLLANEARLFVLEHRLFGKANFNPAQPRNDHGRWTGGGATTVQGGSGEDRVDSTPNGVEYGKKIRRQMVTRGWTNERIDDAVMNGDRIDAINKATGAPATRYVNPSTGQSVVIDNRTNRVLQVGKPNFEFGEGSGDASGAVMRPAPTRTIESESIGSQPTIGGGGNGGLPDIFHPHRGPEVPPLDE